MAAAYTTDDLHALAGAASFERGEHYVTAVSNLRTRNGELHALVQGREPYRVRLRVADGLDGDCTCPHAADGFFCKHLVAVGLAKLTGTGADTDESDDPQTMGATDELREALTELEHTELVELLVDAADHDEHLTAALWWAVERQD